MSMKIFIYVICDCNRSWQDIPIHLSTELALINSQLVLMNATYLIKLFCILPVKRTVVAKTIRCSNSRERLFYNGDYSMKA